MALERPDKTGDHRQPGRSLPAPGLLICIPGAPQWFWNERERALRLFGTFASLAAMSLFTWGTRIGLLLIAATFASHTAAAAESIRQWSFPGFGRWTPVVSSAAAVGGGFYIPALILGSLFAWPGISDDASRRGYLVNRLAYQDAEPAVGDHVWIGRGGSSRHGRTAQVICGGGSEVEWSRGRLKASGRQYDLTPFRQGEAPRTLNFKVPGDHLLVACPTDDPGRPLAWELVPRGSIEGRAWARLYPVWERRLLGSAETD